MWKVATVNCQDQFFRILLCYRGATRRILATRNVMHRRSRDVDRPILVQSVRVCCGNYWIRVYSLTVYFPVLQRFFHQQNQLREKIGDECQTSNAATAPSTDFVCEQPADSSNPFLSGNYSPQTRPAYQSKDDFRGEMWTDQEQGAVGYDSGCGHHSMNAKSKNKPEHSTSHRGLRAPQEINFHTEAAVEPSSPATNGNASYERNLGNVLFSESIIRFLLIAYHLPFLLFCFMCLGCSAYRFVCIPSLYLPAAYKSAPGCAIIQCVGWFNSFAGDVKKKFASYLKVNLSEERRIRTEEFSYQTSRPPQSFAPTNPFLDEQDSLMPPSNQGEKYKLRHRSPDPPPRLNRQSPLLLRKKLELSNWGGSPLLSRK